MTDVAPESSSPQSDRPAKCRGRGRRTAAIVAIALAAGLAGAFASNAISHGRGWHHGGHGFDHMGGPMGFMDGKMDPAKAERRAERMAERFARRIDATGEQQSKLISIARATVKDVMPMRQSMREARKEAMRLMSAPTVDRAALEKLRADQVSGMDAVTKRMATALADAAEVLTPEQRKKVAEHMERRHERRSWWRGEGRGEGRGQGGPGGSDRDGPAPEPKKE